MKRTWLITTGAAALGAIAGYVYWSQVGCGSGACAITSSPLNSTLYGALMGGLLANSFSAKPKPSNPSSGHGADQGDGPPR
ncbi:MAG TPA: DUF6132 family protein [Flavobacteriales bacterium]|nr:DUF6132 family protein [Flavobacteriales bacterium]